MRGYSSIIEAQSLWRLMTGAVMFMMLVGCSSLPMPENVVPVLLAVTASPSSPKVDFTPTPLLSKETLVLPVAQISAPEEDQQGAFWQEPAGCRSMEAQSSQTPAEWLAYADALLGWTRPLAKRALPRIWHPQKKETLLSKEGVYAFDVSDVRPRYLIQNALNALHIAGFAAWLRRDAQNGLEILAVPFTRQALEGVWEEYLRAYWLSPTSSPQGERIIPTMKLTPCRWMVDSDLAPNLPAGTMEQAHWELPDWAEAANAYLADTSEQAYRVAFRINWLGDGENEGPRTMCGPLAWSILCDAQSFPPGYGDWSEGPKTFWLPKPSVNGRPWSLFPPKTYLLQRFDEPAGTFDFSRFPLVAGDVLYLYGKGDGFDHVVLVTEVDGQGNVYAVTNRVWVEPELRFAIQRVVLYNAHDPIVGILRNEWAKDRVNGRTGHGGFEVFRWRWRQKQLNGQPLQTTVEVGDTLPLLAMKWRTPPEQIAAANGLTNDTDLPVGMTVQIP
ncbi:LysM peptidoglycan-binding domain-containing protein [Anaerolinea sp.]|uniref:LysM peptidoglycan-binding domain-containing protein n=1 Tax=Anaerolinea sp. TaxID=1872519 RepID=UPI002ACDD586|nr:LysM peptidoglycan-binding domain-containing protein [Anaerolinea sp.]